MKIVIRLQGVFERKNVESNTYSKSSLLDLVDDLRTIATNQNRHHINSIHQSFGLNFLPQSALEHLLETVEGKSPFLTSKILRPALDNINQNQVSYTYSFSCPVVSLQLSPHDPQLPLWSGEQCDGVYNLDISNDLNNVHLHAARQEALNLIQRIIPVEIIRAALPSPYNFAIPLSLSTGSDVSVWQSVEELLPELQQAIIAIIKNYFPPSLSGEVKKLINDYKQKYLFDGNHNLSEFKVFDGKQKKSEFMIGRGLHRKIIEDLICSAQEFLLISSFRLEDISMVQLIAKKAKELRHGIWILTDFGNNVLDRVDTNMEGKIEHENDYAESDRKKKECLRLLAESGVFIRSGLFHLKCYITERSAYLGSCNLTGGSLERNGEAGIVCNKPKSHQQLINHFSYLWDKQSSAAIIPTTQGVRSYGLSNKFSIARCDGFLTHHCQDLTETLIRFADEPTGEIVIYARTFFPTAQQEELLSRLHCRIFYGHRNYSNLEAKQIYNLHAKVVIVGTLAAYIGSQDFAFGRYLNHDLTYKTTDKNEIQAINQLLDHLHGG